jgi:hypothetical protein
VLPASLLFGSALDLFAPLQDASASPQEDVSQSQIVQALMITATIARPKEVAQRS